MAQLSWIMKTWSINALEFMSAGYRLKKPTRTQTDCQQNGPASSSA
jgi:hypothetical protein